MASIFKRWRNRAVLKSGPGNDRDVESKLYNDLGVALVDQIGTVNTQILLYAVMVDGGIDYSIRYLEQDKRHIRSLPADNQVAMAILNLQNHVESLPHAKRWTALEYWLDNGEVAVALSYDPIDEDVPQWERSPAIDKKYFPGLPLKPN